MSDTDPADLEPTAVSRATPEAAARPKIRILHHMARTGGTVISTCLASMEAVMLLSEINPRGIKYFNPLNQAATWFRLFSQDDTKRINANSMSFTEAIDLIRRRAAERDKEIVIRDWTHLDFTAVPFLPQRSYRLITAEVLRAAFDVVHTATVRHPIDQWLSLRQLAVMNGKIQIEQFLRDYLRFAETSREIGFVRYEDFTRDPDGALRVLCTRLDLPFDPQYSQRWRAYRNITGDVASNAPARDIAPGTRRPMEPGLLDRFEANADYRPALELLGYKHP